MALKHVIVLACACATASAYVAPSRRGARATPLRVATLEKEEKVAVAVEAAVDDLVVAPAIEAAVAELVEEECEVEEPEPECLDEAKLEETRGLLRRLMRSSVSGAGGKSATAADTAPADGDALEAGWEARGKSSSIRRNLEVWRALARCAYKVLKARKGTSEDKTAAATYARDKLLTLGPTFVKLGQVLSTRTDVLPAEYIDVLKSLQDDVPAFSGSKAAEIVAAELGVKDLSEVFSDFSKEPIAAASLGQVHLGTLKKNGMKVAVKVQRAGLKELFATDLKNLRKLCELLDSVDPKSDGADRSYIEVFDESEKLLYEEIDYLNEAKNADRFREDFKNDPKVRVPEMVYEYSTPRVLTMEFIESFKLTDIERVEAEGLDRKDLAKRVADTFLYQIVDTAYFHCDPHPGNLAVDTDGNLVYYDFGMMDELSPNVKQGFKEFCFALFEGGPMISDIQLGVKAKQLVDAVETAGVLAKGADRLSSEQLARYFIRAFKDKQLGVDRSDGPGIKSSLGTELQALTEAQVFRFPSTFTFIFRAIASIDGIGKGLDEDYDLGGFAQPFVERLIEKLKYGGDNSKKALAIFGKATGLNAEDVNTALTQPRKIEYLENTMRAIEQGQLKIRVRSLENEMALTRLGTQSKATTNLLLASLALNVAAAAKLSRIPTIGLFAAAAAVGASGLSALLSLAAFDKKAAKYKSKDFNT
mmetsp:Transcript_32714/g.98425  ORF Transcript_32714/g.98425 Transcript_32714/m.98425 type:complete len:704 (+) Transcript_32714:207-2318(+)